MYFVLRFEACTLMEILHIKHLYKLTTAIFYPLCSSTTPPCLHPITLKHLSTIEKWSKIHTKSIRGVFLLVWVPLSRATPNFEQLVSEFPQGADCQRLYSLILAYDITESVVLKLTWYGTQCCCHVWTTGTIFWKLNECASYLFSKNQRLDLPVHLTKVSGFVCLYCRSSHQGFYTAAENIIILLIFRPVSPSWD